MTVEDQEVNKLNSEYGTRVRRGGKTYDIVDFIPETGEVCVIVELNYDIPPYKRPIACWWTKDVYDFIY